MSSAGRAIGWEFGRRHRLGLIALGSYIVVFWVIKRLILGPEVPIRLDPPNGLAGFIIAPVSITFFYFVGVFSYGLSGDLAARQSIFPARMFTLPVTTRALAWWPMLYGTAAAASLWIATAILVRWPGGVDVYVPWVWPALLTAAYLAWMQALMWMPYGLPGVRVVIAALWLMVVDVIVLVALNYKAREPVMIAICAPQIPVAYLVAWYAVARARRGDVPDWSGLFARLGSMVDVGPRRRKVFLSPARAQTWFEWRRHGRTLPALVAMVVPVELLLLFIPGNDTAPVVFEILFIALITPPFMAAFAAAALSTANTDGHGSYGGMPFMATRPLTSASLIAAKLKMTIWSTIAAWLLVLVAIPLALKLSGTSAVVLDRWRRLSEVVGTPRAVVVVLLILSGCIASTWKQLVQSLYIGLTGRESLIKGSVFLTLVFLFLIGPFAEWIIDNRDLGELWSALPLIFAILVGFKMIGATWIAVRLYHSRLLSDRTLVIGAGCWCLAVLALYGVLVWLLDTPHIPHYLLMLVAILAIPLARLSAAPLALAWNRHR